MGLFLLLYQNPPQNPIVLGQWGTVILTIFTTASLALNCWQIFRSQTTKTLKEAVDGYKEEMNVLKINKERLEGEKSGLENLIKEKEVLVAQLTAKTDLTLVMGLMHESLELTRKFERENAQVQSSVTTVLARLLDTETNDHKIIIESMGNCGDAIKELRQEIVEDRRETSEAFKQVSEVLSGIIRKLGNGERHEHGIGK